LTEGELQKAGFGTVSPKDKDGVGGIGNFTEGTFLEKITDETHKTSMGAKRRVGKRCEMRQTGKLAARKKKKKKKKKKRTGLPMRKKMPYVQCKAGSYTKSRENWGQGGTSLGLIGEGEGPVM